MRLQDSKRRSIQKKALENLLSGEGVPKKKYAPNNWAPPTDTPHKIGADKTEYDGPYPIDVSGCWHELAVGEGRGGLSCAHILQILSQKSMVSRLRHDLLLLTHPHNLLLPTTTTKNRSSRRVGTAAMVAAPTALTTTPRMHPRPSVATSPSWSWTDRCHTSKRWRSGRLGTRSMLAMPLTSLTAGQR